MAPCTSPAPLHLWPVPSLVLHAPRHFRSVSPRPSLLPAPIQIRQGSGAGGSDRFLQESNGQARAFSHCVPEMVACCRALGGCTGHLPDCPVTVRGSNLMGIHCHVMTSAVVHPSRALTSGFSILQSLGKQEQTGCGEMAFVLGSHPPNEQSLVMYPLCFSRTD